MRWVWIAIAAAACGRGDGGAPAAGTGSGSVVVHVRTDAATTDAAPAVAQAFLDRWLATQNGGDFAGYQALYAPGFRGVRRSGKQTVRMTRDAWMKDREKMFGAPMKVTATGITERADQTTVQVLFTQTWESGTYKDEGRKQLVLVRVPSGGFAISYEEMLESRLGPRPVVARPAGPKTPGALAIGIGSAQGTALSLAMVADGDVLLANVTTDYGTGPIEVLSTVRDAAAGSIGAATARRRADGAKLPPVLRALAGAEIAVLDDTLTVMCQGKLGELRVVASDFLEEPGDDSEAGAQLWKQGDYTVAAKLEAPCDGNYVRAAGLPPIEVPDGLATDSTAVARQVKKAVTLERGQELTTQLFVLPAGAEPREVAWAIIDTPDSCERAEAHEWQLFAVTGSSRRPVLTPVASGHSADRVRQVADVDGDGKLEALTEQGEVHLDGTVITWIPVLAIPWPPGLGCDGCEGPEC